MFKVMTKYYNLLLDNQLLYIYIPGAQHSAWLKVGWVRIC